MSDPNEELEKLMDQFTKEIKMTNLSEEDTNKMQTVLLLSQNVILGKIAESLQMIQENLVEIKERGLIVHGL
jgi:hypothetical protein